MNDRCIAARAKTLREGARAISRAQTTTRRLCSVSEVSAIDVVSYRCRDRSPSFLPFRQGPPTRIACIHFANLLEAKRLRIGWCWRICIATVLGFLHTRLRLVLLPRFTNDVQALHPPLCVNAAVREVVFMRCASYLFTDGRTVTFLLTCPWVPRSSVANGNGFGSGGGVATGPDWVPWPDEPPGLDPPLSCIILHSPLSVAIPRYCHDRAYTDECPA